MRRLPLLILLFTIATLTGLVSTSCSDEEKSVISGKIDPEKFPTMKTTDVSTLISDSGITRYKVTSPLWLVFEEAKTPQWQFPKGIHLEKYDDFFRREATVDADRATYFKQKQLWRLDGYVRIANIANEKFLTPQLYWDQRRQKIYSDSFIHIEKADRTIEGYGFESNEQMTDYMVRNVSGIFPASQFKGNPSQSDSTASSQPTQTQQQGAKTATRVVKNPAKMAEPSKTSTLDFKQPAKNSAPPKLTLPNKVKK